MSFHTVNKLSSKKFKFKLKNISIIIYKPTQKAHGENAPSVMSLIYFDDIIETKKIVLEMAEIDLQHLKLEEAKLLIHQMKLYYLNAKENDEKYALLTCFCKKPNEFKHMNLIKQLENDNIKVEQFKKETAKVEETQNDEAPKEQSSEKN